MFLRGRLLLGKTHLVPEKAELVLDDGEESRDVAADIATERLDESDDGAPDGMAVDCESVGDGLSLCPDGLFEVDSGDTEHVGRACRVDKQDVPCKETQCSVSGALVVRAERSQVRGQMHHVSDELVWVRNERLLDLPLVERERANLDVALGWQH